MGTGSVRHRSLLTPVPRPFMGAPKGPLFVFNGRGGHPYPHAYGEAIKAIQYSPANKIAF